jgi:hypothetical protein
MNPVCARTGGSARKSERSDGVNELAIHHDRLVNGTPLYTALELWGRIECAYPTGKGLFPNCKLTLS